MDMGSSKFDVGQKVWLVHTVTKTEYEVCEACKGNYKQVVEWPDRHTTEVVCESCRYHSPQGQSYKVRLSTKTEALWVTGTIWQVSCHMPAQWTSGFMSNERKPREVMYSLKDTEWFNGKKPDGSGCYSFREDTMYASREEAQAYIDQHQVLVEEAA